MMTKINSMLIANRGEIAIRIASTAKKMGIKTYGIRITKEPTALYLQHVDEIIDFPDRDKNEIPEFLDIENIILLAKRYKIDSIHPGYGNLSENAHFATRCTEESITFIGPSPRIIHNMGDKIIAKELAQKSNVPMLGGSDTCIATVDEAKDIAKEIGYPIIIKASAGGGGRGMRIVYKESDLKDMFIAASTEASIAFNNPAVFVEKYLEDPRHIEVQIVADNYGNVIHLGERECTIQRKYQKVIEEAPSCALTPELRKKITSAAVALAKQAKYSSLGTVEFLLDKNNDFYFMEMNTRIQVEHPITEMITGLDLVELQIRIANREKLTIKQSDIKFNGWAIECRINAEDSQADFAPCIGVIKAMRLPEGDNIRIDRGIGVNSEITPHFDSMIAKLIVHSKDRKTAIKDMLDALNNFHVKGVKTTKSFQKAVLNNKKFVSGDFTTSFLEKDLESTIFMEGEEDLAAALFAASHFVGQHEVKGKVDNRTDGWRMNNKLN